jgi:Zn-dependent metalloprotease
MVPTCTCHIVPPSALRRLAEDPDLSLEVRRALEDTLRVDIEVRSLRQQAVRLAQVAGALAEFAGAAAGPPQVNVYDCHHGRSLPGRQITDPANSRDQTVRNVFVETTKVAEFYSSVFGRDSIDDHDMALLSSVHYGVRYNNAGWNGSQMLYGDGDGSLFVDFSKGNDVIGHELTHGVTQYTLQLDYTDDAGGLNESLSDCFGSMFRQWQAGQTVAQADWLIGADIMGPVAKQKGFTCLRDMADPAAAHCLAPQPTKYSQLRPGMDPHLSSGPPNLAFYTACMAAGGKSWETIGKVWYDVMKTAGSHPHLRMSEFAQLTRASASKLFATQDTVGKAVDAGWKHIGL